MLSEPSTLYHEDPIGICLPKTNRSSISVRLVLIPKIFGLPCARCFEDVNVGMIAEMRDAETMAAAVTAADRPPHFLRISNNAADDRSHYRHLPGDQQIRLAPALTLYAFSQRLLPRISGGRILPTAAYQ